MSDRAFQKTVEDFICESCGVHVQGSGYTNHCPVCLISKHVDVNPGDRAAACGGLMDVTDIDMERGIWRVLHTCRKCGHQKWNKIDVRDSQQRLAEVAQQLSHH